jgi:hypothetical protein
MLPQLAIAGAVRRQPQRKKVWLLGALLQAAALACLALTAVFLKGEGTGAAVLGLVIFFSLARGLCSVASKDVIGKTIPKTRRGRLTGFTAALAGTLALAAGLAIVPLVREEASPALFAALIGTAAGLWLLSAWVYSLVVEVPGATEGGVSAFFEALKRVNILRTDPVFRRFVVVRALLISTALAGPYYVVLARDSGGGGELLGMFVLASGLASALSSAFWGRYSDRSSRSVLIMAAAAASGLGVLMFLLDTFGVLQAGFGWIAPAAFFLLSIAHSGVRIGRKTYILDVAGGSRRTDYVAVGNTVIGAVLLASGLLGAAGAFLGAAGMLLVLALLGLLGVLYGTRLPEAQ